uniref:Guanylate cyclase domain-containing protein n=1 Tax=Strongyloides stercoralis TaxID=6248 RepID=A0A0K0DWA7_STRER
MSPDRGDYKRRSQYDSPYRDHRRSDRERRERKHRRNHRDYTPDKKSRSYYDNGKVDSRRHESSSHRRHRSRSKERNDRGGCGRISKISSASITPSPENISDIEREGTLAGEISKQIASKNRSSETSYRESSKHKRGKSKSPRKSDKQKTSRIFKFPRGISISSDSSSEESPPKKTLKKEEKISSKKVKEKNGFSISPPPAPPQALPPSFKPIFVQATTISPSPPLATSSGVKDELLANAMDISPPAPPLLENNKRPIIFNKRVSTITTSEWGNDAEDNYEIEKQVGEGTYGQVFKAKQVTKGTKVALKKVRLENEREGFPITAIREIIILRQLSHKNVVSLLDIVTNRSVKSEKKDSKNNISSFYLVFEYLDHDLVGVLDSQIEAFTELQVASFMKQLAEGLAYCHSRNFLHRDIKGSNILLNNKGEIKLADFGLARFYNEKQKRLYTNRVITLWYRPPELLLGAEQYDTKVDVWSLGCILPEMFTRKPLFQGNNEFIQLECISKICGTPTIDCWPEINLLPHFNNFKPKRTYPRNLKESFRELIPEGALELLDEMLTLDPKRRPSAENVCKHPWLRNIDPSKIEPPKLPAYQDCHELWAKSQKKSKKIAKSNGIFIPNAVPIS